MGATATDVGEQGCIPTPKYPVPVKPVLEKKAPAAPVKKDDTEVANAAKPAPSKAPKPAAAAAPKPAGLAQKKAEPAAAEEAKPAAAEEAKPAAAAEAQLLMLLSQLLPKKPSQPLLPRRPSQLPPLKSLLLTLRNQPPMVRKQSLSMRTKLQVLTRKKRLKPSQTVKRLMKLVKQLFKRTFLHQNIKLMNKKLPKKRKALMLLPQLLLAHQRSFH